MAGGRAYDTIAVVVTAEADDEDANSSGVGNLFRVTSPAYSVFSEPALRLPPPAVTVAYDVAAPIALITTPAAVLAVESPLPGVGLDCGAALRVLMGTWRLSREGITDSSSTYKMLRDKGIGAQYNSTKVNVDKSKHSTHPYNVIT